MNSKYQSQDLLAMLDQLGIRYILHKHEAVFNCQQSEKLAIAGNNGKTKNLFLHNRKKSQYYLVVVEPKLAVDLRSLTQTLGDSKLSFASEVDLNEILGVGLGSVSLLALANDQQLRVRPVIDSSVWSSEIIQCHPLRNDMTLELKRNDLEQFLLSIDHKPYIATIPKKESNPI